MIISRGYQRLVRDLFDVDYAGRRFELRHQRDVGCELVELPSERQVLELTYQVFQPAAETARVTLSSGRRLRWTRRYQKYDPVTGFADDQGRQMVSIFNELQWHPTFGQSAWSMLWRFWASFVTASEFYRIEVDDALAGDLDRSDELIPLIMVGLWMELSQKRRHPSRLAASQLPG
ncbi:hypothetical protein [Microlunatus sp. GCM10028923]|uniref:hypothetical protein n=1 Tax=Microlunatus sp. GCM10028923 TaxID=3273400 RepID=UPI00361385DF